jgi:hypothetical protein
MKKIIHIADFYASEIRGGGELVDQILIDSLVNRGLHVNRIKSKNVTEEFIKQNADKLFIVSNFIMLPGMCINLLKSCDYVIYEHDHKYIVGRDPSRYKDYKVPPTQLINLDFYRSAKAVFAQSKLHAQVIRKNIKEANVINLGCSIWSNEELDTLQQYVGSKKNGKMAVLNSTNQIKGTAQAKSFCEKNGIDYNLIVSLSYNNFIKQLAEHDGLVFFSQVLETFCRLAVEARIVNCKLKTNNNLGCASEEWFSKYKGQELLDFVKSQKTKVIDKVVEALESEKRPEVEKSPITVILNAYRRPYNLRMQIDAIRKQTKRPTQIWLWVNDHEDNHGFDFKELNFDRICHNDHNWKFYGRFAAALLADTEYVAIFDDDTIPGDRWFENCLETMKTNEGIMGSAGYIQTGPRAMQYEPERSGWPRQNEDTMRVDYVGHAWFFKREWLSHLWREKPPTWDNGEDIHFSYTAQKYGGIQTYCPPHPVEDKSLHGSLLGYELGVDSKATSNNQAVSHQQFFSERDNCINNSLVGGWKTVHNIKPEVQK